VEAIFDTLHNLYVKIGARNFVLIDVPPIDRSPGGKGNLKCSSLIEPSYSTEDIKDRIEAWNELLRSHAKEFAKGSKKATTLVFPSHQILTEGRLALDTGGPYRFCQTLTVFIDQTVTCQLSDMRSSVWTIINRALWRGRQRCLKYSVITGDPVSSM